MKCPFKQLITIYVKGCVIVELQNRVTKLYYELRRHNQELEIFIFIVFISVSEIQFFHNSRVTTQVHQVVQSY